ncbi:MAG: hypothetical protein ACYTGQ_09815, partial [Planctomycetota bacterium]
MTGFNFHAASNYGEAKPIHSRSVADVETEARRTKTDVKNLEDEVERLYMLTEAMWTMLKESGMFTDSDLVERVAEIDLRDGRLDGRDKTKPEPTF